MPLPSYTLLSFYAAGMRYKNLESLFYTLLALGSAGAQQTSTQVTMEMSVGGMGRHRSLEKGLAEARTECTRQLTCANPRSLFKLY